MSPLRRRAVLALPLAVGFAPRRGRAHAVLVASDPPQGGRVMAGRVEMVLRFNSRIDRARSRVDVMTAHGERHALTIAPGGSEDTIRVVFIAPAGANAVRWQVLASDGHITRGEISFIADRP